MIFNSFVFVLFLGIVLTIYYLVPKRGAKYVILASSYFFYGWWDWRFLSLIVASSIVDFTVGRMMAKSSQESKRKKLLWLSIAFNLGLLGFFKYFNFFAGSFSDLLATFGMKADYATLHIILPVGISFYTFQTMSYTIDVWRGKMQAEKNFIVFSAFVAFFPQLVAGPIERASHLLPQMQEKRTANLSQIKRGLWLILWGYFLKIFLADNLAPVVNEVYQAKNYSGLEVLIATYAFAFQILGDFAGYSSIAIGVAALFGITLNENFRFPYFTTNPSAFWQNWHISLSSWLRDYLYIPLGGNRCSSLLNYRNLFLTMLLGGLWHGASWNFVAWGIFQGLVLILFRISGNESFGNKRKGALWLLQVLFMFQLTCLGWMLFRSPDLTSSANMLQALFTGFLAEGNARAVYLAVQLAIFTSVPLLLLILQFRKNDPHSNPIQGELRPAIVCTIMIFCLIWMGNWGSESFIYFQF